MDPGVLKFRKLERYLNKLEFNQIKIGSLLSQAFEIAYYNKIKGSSKNFARILKYLSSLMVRKRIKPGYSKFIFTKLINRNHFNELMDPLISHYLNQSTIICSENSFDERFRDQFPENQFMIHFHDTQINRRKDIFTILSLFFTTIWILIKNHSRLNISRAEIIFFVSQLIIQLKSVSYWDYYFSQCNPKPSGVITEFDRNHVSSALISCAKRYKIKTITLTHGVICDYGFTPILADFIFCWGNFQKSQLIKLGVSPERILITGNPLIKNFRNPTGHSNGYKIGFAISPESCNQIMIESFISVIKALKDVTGIIKLHPSLNKTDFKWVNFLSSKVNLISSEEITNADLFNLLDLLIIHQSGIANEALSAGVPVVIYAPDGNYTSFQRELVEVAKCQAATDEKELEMILNTFIANPSEYTNQSLKPTTVYLKNLFEITGEKSVQSMIAGINELIA